MLSKITKYSLAPVVALGLAACSGQGGQSAAPAASNPPSISQATSPAALKEAAVAAKASAAPQPDASVSESSYVKVTSGNQLMFLYAALSGLPPDYDKMATWYSSEYRGTNDSFRKHDLLAALQPKLETQIADAKQHPYVVWEDNSPNLGHYDFDRKGFPVNSGFLADGGYGYVNDNYEYKLGFSNGGAFRFLPVNDDALARRIEAMVGHYDSLHLKIYAFAQTTDSSSNKVVTAVITKVQLLDGKGQVLVE
jgi:hypothetical protein